MEISLQTIVETLPPIECIGRRSRIVSQVRKPTDTVTENDLVWINLKNQESLRSIHTGTVICSIEVDRSFLNQNCTYLLVENPRLYFLRFMQSFMIEKEATGIDHRSHIDSGCSIGKNVTIKAGVVIERDCIVGDNSIIDYNTVIFRGTKIGNNVKIGANCTIGGVGFGYELNEHGEYMAIPHGGNVLIEDFVEIGNNTAIDRAVIGSTVLHRNCKIDNLVHIAHGVVVGENSLIIANAMIAGSTTVGKNVWVAPSASVLNKLSISDNTIIGMGAVVLRDTERHQTIVGNPGKVLSKKKPEA